MNSAINEETETDLT